jgi:hypothetical protein
MKSPLIALIFALGTCSVFAQNDFRSGYVILAGGDSIHGQVGYHHFKDSPAFCKFKSNDSKIITRYGPSDLKAFGYFFDKRYEVKSIETQAQLSSSVFMEVILDGFLSLLKHQRILYVETTDGKLIQLEPRKKKPIEINNRKYLSTNYQYIGVLNSLIKDCGLRADETPYDETPISYLIQNYNRCHNVAGKYYKESPKGFKITLQLFGGMQSSKLRNGTSQNNVASSSFLPHAGFSLDMSSPSLSKKILLSAEFILSQQLFQFYIKETSQTTIRHFDYTIRQNTLKFPIGIRYNLSDEYQTAYFKGGVVFGLLIASDVELITEDESTSIVTTSFSNNSMHGQHAGFYGALGYTHGISAKLKGFAEVRYEIMNSLTETFPQNSDFSSIYLSIGLRF